MGKRIILNHSLIVGLVLLFCLADLPTQNLGNSSSAQSAKTTGLNTSSLESRFIQVFRKNEVVWLSCIQSMKVWFTPSEIIFYQPLSPHKFYQMRLCLNSPDDSKLQLYYDQNKLWYLDILEGIDLCFYFNDRGNLEYDIILNQASQLEKLRFTVTEGQISLTNQGLDWITPYLTIHKKILTAYEQDTLQPIQYLVKTDSKQSFHYELSHPDKLSYPVVIDPEIVFSTYFSESDDINLTSVTTDAAGAIYACGSISLPRVFSTDGLHLERGQDDLDGFLTKTDRLGKELIRFIVFGGVNGDELAPHVELSVNGAVYIAGTTTSDDFPVSENALQSSYLGFGDAFCFVINPETREVLFSSYWGGSQSDNLTSLAVQPSGNAVLVGNTISKDFPVIKATQKIKNDFYDGFLSVIAIEKKQSDFSTFLGGNQQDSIDCITIKKDGSIVVSGKTMSPDFYIQSNRSNRYQGDGDIFITMYSSSYTYAFSNLFGGSNEDYPGDIACFQNDIYLVGTTLSDDFPCTSAQVYHGHNTQDAFDGGDILLIKLQETSLVYAGFLGGSEDDIGIGISLDENRKVYISANTRSHNIPITHNALQGVLIDYLTNTNGLEGYIAKMDENFSHMLFGSYWGGFGDDKIQNSTLYQNQLTLVGYSNSDNFPTTPGSLKVEKNNEQECFLSSISFDYFLPSIPENVSILSTEEGNFLVWSPSQPGEAPIKGYGIQSYVFDSQANPPGKIEYSELVEENLLQYKLPIFEEQREYYFAVCAIDINGKSSGFSKEISKAEKPLLQEPFLLVELYDSDRTTGRNDADILYLNSLESPILEVFHYYPNKNHSDLIKYRKKEYGFCLKNWCLANGSVSLTMEDILEDKQRIQQISGKTHPYRILWEKISVLNEKYKEIKLTIDKTAPYAEISLSLTVLLVKRIVPFHWEILQSEKRLYGVPLQVFGREKKGFSFHMEALPDLDGNLSEYAFSVFLQDPKNHEILAYALIPLSEELIEGKLP